jgi:hypothetical protein
MDLYNYLRSNNLTDLDRDSFFKKYSNPQEGQKIYNYLKSKGGTDLDFNSFNSKYLSVKPTIQQPAKPVAKKTEPGLIDKATNFIADKLDDYKVDLSNLKTPKSNKTVDPLLEGYKPTGNIIDKKEEVENKYNTEYNKKLSDISFVLSTMYPDEVASSDIKTIEKKINSLSPLQGVLKKDLTRQLNELKKTKINKNLELNQLKSEANNPKYYKVSDDESKSIVNKNMTAINQSKEKIKNISKENILLKTLKTPNKNGILSNIGEMFGVSTLLDTWQNYNDKNKVINEENRKIKLAKKDLDYLNRYKIDINKTLASMTPEERLQTEASLDPELKGFLKSAKKLKNREDEFSFNNLYEELTNKNYKGEKDELKVKGYNSEKNLENYYNKVAENTRLRTDNLNAKPKQDLQEIIAQNKLQDIFNVDDIKFQDIIENYDIVKNNPQGLIAHFNDPEAIQKFQLIEQTKEFQEIVANHKLANTVNDARVENNFKKLLENKQKGLNALNYINQLNKNQQLSEDYLEQKAKESGFFSKDNLKFLLSQGGEAVDYTSAYAKQLTGKIGTTVNGDSESLRKLEYGFDLYKEVTDAKGEEVLSPFSDAKWIDLPTKGGRSYQIAVDPKGNYLGARYDKFSIPVDDAKNEQLRQYYFKNKEELDKLKKDITDIDGGFSASTGYIASEVAVGALEELPTTAFEIAATAISRTPVAGARLLSRAPKFANWGNKLRKSENYIKGYNNIADNFIGLTSTYAEVGHDIKKSYEEAGLDPSDLNTGITAGALTGVAQLTPGMEKLARKFGSDLVEGTIRKEAKEVFLTDIPKILPTLSKGLVDIKDAKLKDYLLKKELRNYALSRFTERSVNVLKPFVNEGLQESAEETILEPIAQLLANQANSMLTGNELYNKETLQDLGFLDPETALIAGLTGGVMSSGINTVSNLMLKDKNGLNSLEALQAAMENPNKFKSLLSTYIQGNSDSDKTLTQEKYDEIISNFDNIKANVDKVKKDYNLNNEFTTKTNLDNSTLQTMLKSAGLNKDNFSTQEGSNTLEKIILQNEINNTKKQDLSKDILERLGVPNDKQELSLDQFLDQNGLFDTKKYAEITGNSNLDPETAKIVANYNQLQTKDLKLKNTLNLFNENFKDIQDNYLNSYQEVISNSPDLTRPELSIYDDVVKDKLYNKAINDKRIAQLEKEISSFENVEKDKKLNEELRQLKDNNQSLQKSIDNITNTYKEGFIETQDTISALEDEYMLASANLNNALESYYKTDDVNEEEENNISELIANKSKALAKLKKEYNAANKKYNNGITANTLKASVLEERKDGSSTKNVVVEKDFSEDLEKELKKGKDYVKKIKRYKELLNKFKTSFLTKQEFLEFRKFQRSFDNKEVLKNVLPYFASSLTKEEIDTRLSGNLDLTISLFNNLMSLGYIMPGGIPKQINSELLITKVQNALLTLNRDLSLINSNRINEIPLFTRAQSAMYVNSLIDALENNNKKEETSAEKETTDETADPIIVEPEAIVNPTEQSYTTIEKPVINATNKQQEALELIEKNSIKRSDLNDEDITDSFYIINNKPYQRVTTVDSEKPTISEALTAGSNVGNFLDNVGRIIFGNNNITEKNADEIFNILLLTFKEKGIELEIDKDNYLRTFKYLVDRRNDLITKGYIFISDERVIYNKYDGVYINTGNLEKMPEGSVGIAGTMDIVAIAPNGTVDIIDLKSVSDNSKKASTNASLYKKTKWAKQLGIYKTLLEKINGVKVNNLKVLRSNVTYNVNNNGNRITNLRFTENNFENINVSKEILEVINNYLSIPTLVVDPTNNVNPVDDFIEDNPEDSISESAFEDIPFPDEDEFEIPEDSKGIMDFMFQQELDESLQESPVFDDVPIFEDEGSYEYDSNEEVFIDDNTEPTLEEADRIFGTTDVEENTILRTDLEINLNNNERGSKNFSEKDNTIWVSADPRVVFKRLFREKGIRTNSPIVLSNVRTINNQKIYEFYRQNPDATNDQGFIGFSFILNKELDLTDAQIEEITNLAQNIIDRFAIENGKVKYYSSMGEQQRNNIREEFANGILNIINNKQALESKQTPLQPTEKSKQESLQTNLATPTPSNLISQTVTQENTKSDFEENSNFLEDQPLNNYYDTGRYTYINYEVFEDENGDKEYLVSVYNNFSLDKLFGKKKIKEKELQEIFKNNNLFFSPKIKSKGTYLLLSKDKQPIDSYVYSQIKNNPNVPFSTTINSVNYQDLEGLEGEIVLLDVPYNNTLKNEKDFRDKASLGIRVAGEIVAMIPSFSINNKNSQVRNTLNITNVNGVFQVEPFKVKIDKVKEGSMIFNQSPVSVSKILDNPPTGFTVKVAYVGIKDKQKVLVNAFGEDSSDSLKNISASKLTQGGVYLILEKNGKVIKVPLNTPKVGEVGLLGKVSDNIKKKEIILNTLNLIPINYNNNIASKEQLVTDNYTIFLDALRKELDKPDLIPEVREFLEYFINVLPDEILPESVINSANVNQKLKFKALQSNFNNENLVEFLLNTLINLNKNTVKQYSTDADISTNGNLFGDNSVSISYTIPKNTQDNLQETSSQTNQLNWFEENTDNIFC